MTEANRRAEQEKIQKAEGIKSPADYHVSMLPSVKAIIDSVNDDESVTNKTEKKCMILRERIENLQANVVDLDKKKREALQERDNCQVHLQQLQRELDAAAIKRLGLLNINYQPEEKKKPKVSQSPVRPSGRLTNAQLEEAEKWAKQFGLETEWIISTMKRSIQHNKPMSIEDAARLLVKQLDLADKTSDSVSSVQSDSVQSGSVETNSVEEKEKESVEK